MFISLYLIKYTVKPLHQPKLKLFTLTPDMHVVATDANVIADLVL